MASLLTNNSYKNQCLPASIAGCGLKTISLLLLFVTFNAAGAQGVFNNRPGAKNIAAQSFTNVTEGTYFIKVNQTGKFLGVEGISKDNGARLVEWDFFNQDNHKFVVKKASEPGYYTIMAVHSGKYLNVEGAYTNDGARIIQWDYVNQDNLKWAFVYNKILNGLTIINKQTGKAISLSGSINNAVNGTVIALNGSSDGTQYFSLVPVENAIANTSIRDRAASGDNLPAKLLTQYVYLDVPGGTRIKRKINTTGNPAYSNIKKRTGDVRRIVKVTGGNTDDCKTYTANASTVEQNDYMIVSNSNMMLNFAPGLIYDIGDLYSGNLMDRAKFPYGQSRAPMQLITSVKNLANRNDTIAKIVTTPDINGLNQAVAGFYQSATTNAAKTSAENVRYYACEINSTTEMALKIGGGGHYLFFSAGSDLQVNNSTEYRTMYFEGVKELFSITARPASEGGMFLQDPGNTSNLGYISSVTYGVRIVGKVEISNVKDATTASMQTSFNMGFAGADINLSDFKASSNAKTKVTLYAVGGRADAIGTCTVDNIKATIDNYLKTVNYQVAQPIKLKCSTLDGKLISFVDATDNFTYTVCEPAALKNAGWSINVKDLMLIGENDHNTDFDLYGKVFVKAFDAQGREIPAINNTNMLMDVRGANNIDMSEPNRRSFETNNTASFYFPPGTASGNYLVVYYGLFDQDANEDYGTGDDDQFSYRNGGDPDKNCDLGPTSTRLCTRRINLDNFGGNHLLGFTDNLWNAQDETGLELRYTVQKISDPVSQ